MLQFRQIQAFHSIMETGTVTQAAKRLGISQPGVSNLIANLEHELGFALFIRIGGRLQPTPEAYRLAGSTDNVMAGFEQVNRQASAIRNLDIGKLDIACLPELSMAFVPAVIRDFITDKPDINISFQTRSSTTVQELVASHSVEIGIAEAPLEHDNLEAEHFSYECLCVLPADHALAGKTSITPEDLHGAPLITLGPYHLTYHRLREIFTARQCIWNDRCQTRLFHTALTFVEAGFGVALIDPFTIDFQALNNVVVRKFEPGVAFDLAIIRANNKPVSNIGSAFMKQLKTQMATASVEFAERPFSPKL